MRNINLTKELEREIMMSKKRRVVIPLFWFVMVMTVTVILKSFNLSAVNLYFIWGVAVLCWASMGFINFHERWESEIRLAELKRQEKCKKILEVIENKQFSDLVIVDQSLLQKIFQKSIQKCMKDESCTIGIKSNPTHIQIEIGDDCIQIPKLENEILKTFQIKDCH